MKVLSAFAWMAMALFSVMILAGCAGIPSAQSGRTVFTMADKAADMGAVSSIMLTVDRVDVQSGNGTWVGVSSTARTYDLIALRNSGEQALLADAHLPAGDYNQVRLSISNVVVTDATGAHTAKLPSGELRLVGRFNVNSSANATSAVSLDFAADRSLHVTGNGQYILAPVVHLQTRENAEIEISDRNNVTIRGGRMRSDAEMGMDENGKMGEGVRIRSDTNLTVDDSGIIRIGTGRENEAGGGDPNGGRAGGSVTGNAANASTASDIVIAQAVAQKDVGLCTRLTDQNSRYICITAWCGSEARDYKQCSRLTNYDDNLACLNKCNPNSNT